MKKKGIIIFFLALISTLTLTGQARAGFFTNSEIRSEVKRLAMRLEVPPEKIADLMLGLAQGFDSLWFQRETRTRQVKAVFVFYAGKGGFILTYMEGEGQVSFADGRRGAPIYLKSWSVGAQAGGKAMWGVGLVLDLKHNSDFGGNYTGRIEGATALDTSTSNWSALSKTDDAGGYRAHDVLLLISGRGLAAGVAVERLTIAPGW